jgi:hypothetical protein
MRRKCGYPGYNKKRVDATTSDVLSVSLSGMLSACGDSPDEIFTPEEIKLLKMITAKVKSLHVKDTSLDEAVDIAVKELRI